MLFSDIILVFSKLWQTFREVPTYVIKCNVLAINILQVRQLDIKLNTRLRPIAIVVLIHDIE